MASAVDSRLAYARLIGGRYGKPPRPQSLTDGSNNSYTTSSGHDLKACC